MKSHSILDHARNRRAIGFGLSLLLHAALLLFALEHITEPIKESGFFPDAPLEVNLIPPSDASRAAAAAATTASRPQPRKGHPDQTDRKETPAAARRPVQKTQPQLAQRPTPAPAPQPQKALPADMSDMLTAARDRRRAAGIPDANDAPDQAQQENDPDAVARDNVAFSTRTRGHNDGGGVFEVTSKGVRSAELIFHGWDVRRRNTSRQAFEIDAGLNGDIDTAIIRKMIELIRQQKSGDFQWESRRLGRVVTLSARPQDDAALMDFLKKDFFDLYQ
jgi:outer membrane biosynthesis protein TonB